MRSWSRLDDVVQRPAEPVDDLLHPRGARLRVGRQVVAAGVEARLEELDQQPGDVDVGAQRVLDVVQGERRVALPHVLRVGAQHRRLPPGQPGAEHQAR